MVSVNKIMKVFLLVAIIFVALVLSINFFFLPATKTALSTTHNEIEDIKNQVIAMELPIRVIDNVVSQFEESPEKKSNTNLIESFDNNLMALQLLNHETTNHISEINKALDIINRYSLFYYKPTVEELYQVNNEIIIISKALEKNLSESQTYDLNMDVIKSNGTDLIVKADVLTDINHALTTLILDTYTLVVNLFFIILIVMLLLLLLASYRMIRYERRFILDSLENLELKRFDFKKLPELKPIFKEEYTIYNRMKFIFKEEEISQNIKNIVLSTYHIDDLIDKLFIEMSKTDAIDRIGVAFVDYSSKKFVAEYGKASYDDVKLGSGFEVNFDKTTLTHILANKKSFITNDLEKEYKKRPHSASLSLLRKENVQSNLVVPLILGDAVYGVIFFSSLKKNYFDESDMKRVEKIIYEIGGLLNKAYFAKVVLSRITNSFAELVDQKDDETGGHILRMVAYSTLIASRLREKNIKGYEVNQKFVLEIERNASSHDIGKVGIPDDILKKPGKLTPDEWTIMKTHASIGADIFKSLREGLQVFDADFYGFAEDIARFHHERWDGTGYPSGLSGKDIPLSARIVAIADVFDALTSKRHYKEPFGFEKSIDIIKASAGSHLDAVLVDVFLEDLDELIKIQELYDVE